MSEEKYKEFWDTFTVPSPSPSSVQTSLPLVTVQTSPLTPEKWLNHVNKNLIKEQHLEVTIGGKDPDQFFFERNRM